MLHPINYPGCCDHLSSCFCLL
uniref:Uncharacterized protein n=1 Tax=Lepeophtheirus salmonis TaxID=72036 RepID=A0A0K2VAN5_LEPSM